MSDFILGCPPVTVGFVYGGEDAFEGKAREAFRCGMFLMLNYDGPEDSKEKFQEVFGGIIRNDEVGADVLEALASLLVSQLTHFDEWFYDEALERLFRLMEAGTASDYIVGTIPRLSSQLLHRGYKLEKTRRTLSGSLLEPEPET